MCITIGTLWWPRNFSNMQKLNLHTAREEQSGDMIMLIFHCMIVRFWIKLEHILLNHQLMNVGYIRRRHYLRSWMSVFQKVLYQVNIPYLGWLKKFFSLPKHYNFMNSYDTSYKRTRNRVITKLRQSKQNPLAIFSRIQTKHSGKQLLRV